MRVVKGGLGSLTEVQTQWSFDDLMSGIEYLDILDSIEEIANSGNS